MVKPLIWLALLVSVGASGHQFGHNGHGNHGDHGAEGSGRRLGEKGHGIDQSKYHTMPMMEAGGMPPHPGPRPGPPPHDSPCKMDFMRFCAFRVDDMQNMEEIITCMKTHDEQLQPECKVIIDDASETLAEFHTACDASLESFACDVTKPSSYKPCLIEHLDGLDKPCLKAISDIMISHMPKGPESVPEWAVIDPMGMGMGPGGVDMMGLHHVIVKSILCAAFIVTLVGLTLTLLIKCCARHMCPGRMCRRHCHGGGCKQTPMGVPIQEGLVMHQQGDAAYAVMA